MKIKHILLSAVLSVGVLLSAGCSGASQSGNTGDMNLADGDMIAVFEIKDYGTIKAKLFPDIAPIGVENFVQLTEQGYYNGLKIHRVLKDNVIQGGSLNGDGTGGIAAYTGEDNKDTENPATTFPIEVSDKARNYYGALGYAADGYGQNAAQFYLVGCKTSKDVTKTDPAKVQARADELASQAAAATWEADSSAAKVNSYIQSYYSNNASMLSKIDKTAAKKYSDVGGLYEIDGAYTVFGQVYEGFEVIDKISEVEVETNAQGEKSMPVQDIIISSVRIEIFKSGTAEADDTDKNNPDNPEKITTEEPSTASPSTSETKTADAGESIATIDTNQAEQGEQDGQTGQAEQTEQAG